MKSIISAAIAILFSTSALATGNEHHKPPKPSRNSVQQNQGQGQAQLQGQLQGQGQAQVAMGGAGGLGGSAAGGQGGTGGSAMGGSAAGGTAIASVGAMNFAFTVPGAAAPSTAFVSHDYSGMPQQAPAMGNSYINTSNGCDSAAGLGFVFPGGGVNFSGTALRMMCEGRLNSQAHKALGDEDKARKVMRVVDEYACSQDAVWAKIAREEGICKPDTAPPATQTNPAFNSN